MLVFVGLSHAVDKDVEQRIEATIMEWFHSHKRDLNLVGVYPFDPVILEFAVEIGDQPSEMVLDSLDDWLRRLEIEEAELVVSDRSVLERMSVQGRCDHLKRKLLFILGSVRQINRSLSNPKLRNVEYLLTGLAEEAGKLLDEPAPHTLIPPAMEDTASEQLDEFWKNL
jgi:hypothetical protein